MRVVALFRVSTEKQANDGASLDAQERRYHELARSSGWETVAVFRGCESATLASRERAVLQEVLTCIRRTEPNAIYVHEQSRLTRGDELEVAGLLRELRERQLKIIVGGVVRDLASLDERFMIGIQSLVDRAESERIKERHQRGKREKAKKGLKNSGPAPFGYRNPPPGDPERGVLQIVEAEAAVVRRIFALALDGHGTRSIAATLNAEGIPSSRRGRWGKTSVSRVLSNPGYRGCHITGGWVAQSGSRTFRFDPDHPDAIVVEGAHEAIVPPQQWHAAQQRRTAPTPRPRMLCGLLSLNGLSACGDSLKRRAYYRPPRGSRGGPWIPAETADTVVWGAFVTAVSEPEFLEQVVSNIQASARPEEQEQEIEVLAAHIAKLESRLGRLVDMRADGEIPSTEFRQRSGDTRGQLKVARRRQAELQHSMERSDGQWVQRALSAVKLLVASQRALSGGERRRILQRVVQHVDIRAKRRSAKQAKDRLGRYQAAEEDRWWIESVTFNMILGSDSGDGHLAITD